MDIKKIHDELRYFFKPRSVAVIGASHNPAKVGYGVLKGLLEGGMFSLPHLKGFSGKVFAINPKAKEVLGMKCYAKLEEVQEKVDLAIICIPARMVLRVMKDCVRKRVKAIIIISAGFAEAGAKGIELQEQILQIAKQAKIRVVGPNCLGILYPPNNLNASFGPALPLRGEVAFISQSGALADSVIDWSLKKRYGFSAMISYGDKADLDAPDFIGWAGKDPHTKAITLYIEGLNDGRYFLEVAKKVSRIKPIISMKAGRSRAGTKAISSHTGSLAGAYDIYKGAYRQAGVIMAETLTDLFDMAKALAWQPPARGDRVAIVTNGGGCGVSCADSCEGLGIKLPYPPKEMVRALDSTGKMHPAWSRSNPLDVIGDASPERYRLVLDSVMRTDYYDGIIVIQTLQTMTDTLGDAKVIVQMQQRYKKPVVTSFMEGIFTEKGLEYLRANHIPNYNDVSEAARAMWALIEYGRYLKKLAG